MGRITRDDSLSDNQFLTDQATASGAFELGAFGVTSAIYGGGGNYGYSYIDFSASRDNATYNGSKVQPSALSVLVCIKI